MLLPVCISVFLLSIGWSMFIINKRKKNNESDGGIKSYLSMICLYAIALFSVAGVAFDILGIWHSVVTILLLLLAGYFTKFIPRNEES
ncbi:hypothetical protein [Pseudalkalibacillus caeni]|uniref:Group-specific protein n=1 Tax=Exobacillus caeni TaxID=2574798 RepID=A0A5R9F0Z1_9BACL|nr:hypothetical protein [Pseudalkalibacillus caeni]TLS37227.1 hypothetical protein FCL54_11930 [Pseudalkalibacillus caeni]